VPAKRAAEILGVVGALFSVLCGQSGNLMNTLDLSKRDYTNGLSLLTRVNTPWSPFYWAAQGLTAIGRGEWWPGLPLSLLSIALAAAIFVGALWLAERLYYTGWAGMQGNARKKKNGKAHSTPKTAPTPEMLPAGDNPLSAVQPARQTTAAQLINAVPQPVRGMLVKDFHLLRRDPRNVSQLITPLIFGVIMLFSLFGRSRGPARLYGQTIPGVALEQIEFFGLIALAIFVGWMLLLNLSTLAFTREGRSYWMLKASPISPWQLIFSKYTVSYLPAAAFCLTYLVIAYFICRLDWVYFPYSAAVILLSIAGAAGIALAFGISGANLEWDSPQRMRLRGGAGCLVVIVVLAYLGLELVLFLLPPILWLFITGGAPWYAYAAGLFLGGIGAALGVILPLWMAYPRLARIGEA
jgi:ABC-2 type transport system permease protein